MSFKTAAQKQTPIIQFTDENWHFIPNPSTAIMCVIRWTYPQIVVLLLLSLSCLVELVQKASKDDSRDFLFYLAVANYRLKVSIRPKLMTILLNIYTQLILISPPGIWESPDVHQNPSKERAWEQTGSGPGKAHWQGAEERWHSGIWLVIWGWAEERKCWRSLALFQTAWSAWQSSGESASAWPV